jgi:hypothetical protein
MRALGAVEHIDRSVGFFSLRDGPDAATRVWCEDSKACCVDVRNLQRRFVEGPSRPAAEHAVKQFAHRMMNKRRPARSVKVSVALALPARGPFDDEYCSLAADSDARIFPPLRKIGLKKAQLRGAVNA